MSIQKHTCINCKNIMYKEIVDSKTICPICGHLQVEKKKIWKVIDVKYFNSKPGKFYRSGASPDLDDEWEDITEEMDMPLKNYALSFDKKKRRKK